MDLTNASRIANDICRRLEPACVQLQIAGGIRRRKQDPHDMEPLPMPTEASFFAFLDMSVPNPTQRIRP